jgi:hypothetical protein
LFVRHLPQSEASALLCAWVEQALEVDAGDVAHLFVGFFFGGGFFYVIVGLQGDANGFEIK